MRFDTSKKYSELGLNVVAQDRRAIVWGFSEAFSGGVSWAGGKVLSMLFKFRWPVPSVNGQIMHFFY